MGLPMVVLDFQSVVALGVLAFVVMRIVDGLVKPLWDHFSLDHKWLFYVAFVVGVPATWLSGLNILPIFPEQYALAGRLLTCLAGGLGPGGIYDLLFDKPQPPQE